MSLECAHQQVDRALVCIDGEERSLRVAREVLEVGDGHVHVAVGRHEALQLLSS